MRRPSKLTLERTRKLDSMVAAFALARTQGDEKKPMWGLMAHIARDMAEFCDTLTIENAAFYPPEEIRAMADRLYPHGTPREDMTNLLHELEGTTSDV